MILLCSSWKEFLILEIKKGKSRYYDDYTIVQRFAGHTESVKHIATNFEINRAVSCGNDKSVRIWDLSNGCCLRTIKIENNATKVVWITNNIFAAISKHPVGIHLWQLPQSQYDDPLELSTPESIFASIEIEEQLSSTLTNISQLEREKRYEAAYKSLRNLQKMPDLVRDRTVLDHLELVGKHGIKSSIRQVWAQSAIIRNFPIDSITSISQKRLLMAVGGRLEFWDWLNGILLNSTTPIGENYDKIHFDSEEKALISVGKEINHLRVWNHKGNEFIPTKMLPFGAPLTIPNLFDILEISQDWSTIISIDVDRKGVFLWDLDIEELIFSVNEIPDTPVGLSILPNSQNALILFRDGTSWVIDIGLCLKNNAFIIDNNNKFAKLNFLKSHLVNVERVFFDNQEFLYAFLQRKDQDGSLVDLQNKQVLILPDSKGSNHVQFFDNNRKIALLNKNRLLIFSCTNKQSSPLYEFVTQQEKIQSFHITNSGRFLFIGDSNGKLEIWELDWLTSY